MKERKKERMERRKEERRKGEKKKKRGWGRDGKRGKIISYLYCVFIHSSILGERESE